MSEMGNWKGVATIGVGEMRWGSDSYFSEVVSLSGIER